MLITKEEFRSLARNHGLNHYDDDEFVIIVLKEALINSSAYYPHDAIVWSHGKIYRVIDYIDDSIEIEVAQDYLTLAGYLSRYQSAPRYQ